MNRILALQKIEAVPSESTFCISASWSDWSIHTA